MKIAVAVKQVPDTETKVAVGADGRSVDLSNVTWIVNPYDEYALEEAIRIREAKGSAEVIAVTLGPERTAQALRTCLAVGADRAVLVKTDAVDGADPLTVARILAAVMKELAPDLILTGHYAVGTDDKAVGPMVAELVGMPHVAVVTKLTVGEGKVTAEREIEGAVEVHEAPLPCLITAQKGLNDPRYASLKGIMAAKKKPIEERALDALGLDAAALKARARWERLEIPSRARAGKILQAGDDPAAAARELVRLLHEEAKAI